MSMCELVLYLDLGRDGGGEPRLEEVTVTSCSVPLASCHGAHVTTVEGLGSTRRGLHPVQVRPCVRGTRDFYYCARSGCTEATAPSAGSAPRGW